MIRVFIADRDDAYEFVGDCPEQAIVYLPDSDDLDERDFTLYALGEQLVEQEDTTYIHEAMAQIEYACHLEERVRARVARSGCCVSATNKHALPIDKCYLKGYDNTCNTSTCRRLS